MHYITGNLMLPISEPSATLDNVSYYIMLSGACDRPASSVQLLRVFVPSPSRFSRRTSGLLPLWECASPGGGLARVTQAGRLPN